MTTEVVTRALVRDLQLPVSGDGSDGSDGSDGGVLALITLDNGRDHTRPTTLGAAGLANLGAVLAELRKRAEAGEIAAVAVTGKPFIFCAGADLTMAAASGSDREAALDLARTGHDVFRQFSELGVPSFAFVNGLALGGGLEVTLHCTYRTVSAAVTAVGLPECSLSLAPGWGGSYLLPKLIGIEHALQVIIANPMNSNRLLTAAQAFELGIFDALIDSADFLEQSVRWAADVLGGRRVVERDDAPPDQRSWDGAVAGARSQLDDRLHGAAPAPYRALDLLTLARSADRDTAFEAESQVLADLMVSAEFRACLYAFNLVNKRAKRPAGAPDRSLARPVTTVGVVGAGLMASQLALLFVRRLQVPVILTDLDQPRVDAGVASVHREIEKLRAKGRISTDNANRLTALVSGSTERTAFGTADLVIEAVFEDLAVKQQVFAELEAVVSPQCLLMTNTSSLSVTKMAEGLAHPERVVGFHVFNPVAVMPLVEIIKAEHTDQETLATAFALGAQLKKSCVLVKDATGFVVNRLLMTVLGKVIETVDDGTPVEVADRAMAALGLPMSPFALLELVGPGVALHVSQTLHAAFPDRFRVSPLVARLVAAGKPGVWSRDGSGNPYLDDDVRALSAAALPGRDTVVLDEAQVLDRALVALTREARLMLDEGVVAEAEDLDLCMLLGAGWPFHLGGITPYLDRSGLSERITGRRFLAPGVADPGT